MIFRILLLVPIIALAACDGSDSSAPVAPTADATFSDAANAQLATLNAKLAETQTKLDQLNGRINSTDAGIGPVSAKIDALATQVKVLSDSANTSSQTILRLAGDGTKPGEIAKATDDLAKLIGEKADLATIAGAEKRLGALKTELKDATDGVSSAQDQMALLTGEGTPEKPGIAKLTRLLAALDSTDESGAIQKARTKLTTLADDAAKVAGILGDAEQRLAKLSGDGTEKDPGDIGKALAKLKTLEDAVKAAEDRLAALLGNGTAQNPGLIAKARDEVAALIAKSDALRETIKLQTARAEAATLNTQGKVKEAAAVLKEAGLISEAAAIFTGAGMAEEAYKLFAPEDYVLDDKTRYDGAPSAKLAGAVNERPSVKRHSMVLNGETFWYTASAGHLTAFAKNPQKGDPQASIFYTAYTRDDLPHENRPITFFFNGGPGASSIYLHLGSFAPMRAFTDGPNVKPEWAVNAPDSFPLVDDAESLIDKSDLVFVDITPGTGHSQAIAPNTNETFWGVTVDVELSRQFITRYVNVNHRQLSPKYLYGESYGGGVRVPKLARALEEAGTNGYEATPTGAKPKILTGVIFHSPAFNYSTNDNLDTMLPTIAMTADYLKITKQRGTKTIDEYAQELRDFMKNEYLPAMHLEDDIDISKYTGPSGLVLDKMVEGSKSNEYDARMFFRVEYRTVGWFIVRWTPYFDPMFFEERALNNVITAYLPDYVNYKSASPYINASWDDWFHHSKIPLANESWVGSTELKNGLPDIVATIGYDPSIKLLTVHGYYDAVTRFYRSELDLKGVKLDDKTTLLDRIPVKNFAGGHMIYYSEEARAPLKKALAEFYDAPPYGTGPTAAKALEIAEALPVSPLPAAVPAISLH